jgi:hypothetical protein
MQEGTRDLIAVDDNPAFHNFLDAAVASIANRMQCTHYVAVIAKN